MTLVFVTGTDDVGPIVELASKGPSIETPKVIHLTPKTASNQLLKIPKNLVVSIKLTQINGEIIEFPYSTEFFTKYRPDLFILLECERDDQAQHRINTHLALMSNAKAIKIIKMDRDNIKKVLLDIRKTLAQVLE